MPFEPNNPNQWIDKITRNEPPFIRCLCKSLYFEGRFVCCPQKARQGKYVAGAAYIEGIAPVPLPADGNMDPDDPDVFIRNMPREEQVIPAADVRYDALVRQEDPEARLPWAFAVAAFKYCEGNVPQTVQGADSWPPVMHLYAGPPDLPDGAQFDAIRDANHYTQSAGLVAVHPVVHHLMAHHSCIVNTLRARAFAKLKYDPTKYFAPQARHDALGFVI